MGGAASSNFHQGVRLMVHSPNSVNNREVQGQLKTGALRAVCTYFPVPSRGRHEAIHSKLSFYALKW